MARVYFMRNFDYHIHARQFIAYKAGTSHTVKRECADLAIAGGYAIEEAPPARIEDKPPRRTRTRRQGAIE